MSVRVRIGELLINAGLLTQEQLSRALEQQREQGAGGRRLGALLVELKFVSEAQLTRVLSQQLSVPWVSLNHIDFSRQLLNLVPRELAEEFGLIPVYVRNERKAGETLYLAMEDPTHEEAIRRVTAAAGLPVKAMIAAPSDLRAALRAYYDPDRKIESVVPRARPSIAPRRSFAAPSFTVPPAPALPRAEPVRAFTPAAGTPSITVTDAPPTPAASEPIPKPKRFGPRAPIVSLTLLDGTVIRVPSQKKDAVAASVPKSEPATTEDKLTSRDLIRALRAVSEGASADELLGDARWETLFGALLSLLLKKELITDWEFVEEWQKM